MKHTFPVLFTILILVVLIIPACASNLNSSVDLRNIPIPAEIHQENGDNIAAEWYAVKDDFPKSPNGRNYIFDRITTDRGLSQNTVRSVIQDRFGFIWIGTDGGLNRYDGDSFLVFTHDQNEPASISSNQIWDILEDSSGLLWIGTDNGLNQLQPSAGTFESFLHDERDANSLSENRIRVLLEDSRGFIWIGTWGGGLDRFNPRNGEFVHYQMDDLDPDSLSNNYIRTLVEDLDGNLWIGTLDGLNRLNVDSGIFTVYRQSSIGNQRYPTDEGSLLFEQEYQYYRTGRPTPLDIDQPDLSSELLISNEIHALVIDEQRNRLWIGTASGLDSLDLTSGEFDHFRFDYDDPHSLSSNMILSLYQDVNGTIWVGTNNGLNERRDDGGFNRYQPDSRNPENPHVPGNQIINTIYQDNAGGFWIGTSGNGVNCFNHATDFFLHAYHDPDIQHTITGNMVWAIEEDSDIGFWIGTNLGVNRYNLITGRFESYPLMNTNAEVPHQAQIYTLLKDLDGETWAGSSDGLYWFDISRRAFVAYKANIDIQRQPENPFEDMIILDIAQFEDDELWLATYGSGLIRLNTLDGSIRVYSFDPGDDFSISSNFVSCLLFNPDGVLYVGTSGGGLNILDGGRQNFTRYISDPNSPDRLSDNNINALAAGREGSIWIATTSGLNRLDPDANTFEIIDESRGLSSDVIYGVVVDAKGDIWVSTNNGITHVQVVNERFQRFDFKDGLQSNEFNPGAAFLASEGWIFFGGINGMTVFHPQLLRLNPTITPAMLSAFSQNREAMLIPTSLGTAEEITLEWPRNYFEFKPVVNNFINPERNQAAYKLFPVDEDWVEVAANSVISYQNLESGDYALLLKGANASGVWSRAVRVMDIRVVPPIWETNQFRYGVSAAVAIIAVLIVQQRMRNVRQYSRRLEKEVASRTEDIERRRLVAEGLREILLRINSEQSIEETLDFVACQANRMLDTDLAFIFEAEGTEEMNMRALAGDAMGNLNSEALMKGILEKRNQLVANQASCLEVAFPDAENMGGLTAKICPIRSLVGVLGGFGVAKLENWSFEAEDLALLKSLADQAAMAIENERLRQTAEDAAVASERARIARDLHDAITQTLFSANLIAESLPEVWQKNEQAAADSIADLQSLNQSAMAEMRTLLLELRPDVVAQISMRELLSEMRKSIEGRTTAAVHLDIQENAALPKRLHQHFYRVAQEAVANIIKHANADHVYVGYKADAKMIDGEARVTAKLSVRDDGAGFNKEQIKGAHFGLRDMRERAADAGAQLRIDSKEGNGTSITLSWKGNRVEFEECE